MANTTLRLGKLDKGKLPTNLANFFKVLHRDINGAKVPQKNVKFRDDGNNVWRPLIEIEGSEVTELQHFLRKAGFMPNGKIDGIFGYRTCASVRLFQEYIRTIEKDKGIGKPDGIVGNNTKAYIKKWKETKEGTPDMVCKWGQASIHHASPNFEMGISILEKAKNHYLNNSNEILEHISRFPKGSDTRKIADWDTSRETVHLIGIRRNQDVTQVKRTNDDLFVLLINGMTFCFWGSTDPNPALESSKYALPYLIEGQHLYRFGWHKKSAGAKVYKALCPAKSGVLIFRNKDENKGLTEADMINGLDPHPNTTINIHWSGVGGYNFSAGCQVIAGLSYLNNEGEKIDCSAFASRSYDDLSKGKTRGAYNMLSDLILTYAPKKKNTICYTLGRDETSELYDNLNGTMIEEIIKKLKG